MQEKTFQPIDFKTALLKAEAYCAYQERSQYEVRGKLISLGIRNEELENIILHLIEHNFLNEERFAIAYANGKFRMKGWGKNKIKQGLKLKQTSLPLIKKALNQIDDEQYLAKLSEIIDKKLPTIKEKIPYQRNFKLAQYALSRGFENDLIFFTLKTKGL